MRKYVAALAAALIALAPVVAAAQTKPSGIIGSAFPNSNLFGGDKWSPIVDQWNQLFAAKQDTITPSTPWPGAPVPAGSIIPGTTTIGGTPVNGNLLYVNGTLLGQLGVTGTAGNVVLSNSPTLVTPNLGTPSIAVLTNATQLPPAGGGLYNATNNAIPYGQTGANPGFVSPVNNSFTGWSASGGAPVAVSLPTLYASSKGVKCDGSTDDSANLNSVVSTYGGTYRIVLPKGPCILTAANLNVTGNNIYIEGAGQNQTTLQTAANLANGLVDVNVAANIYIAHLTINTVGTTTSAVTIDCKSQNITLDDVGYDTNINGDTIFDAGDTTQYINNFWFITTGNTWALNLNKNVANHTGGGCTYAGNNHAVLGGSVYGGPGPQGAVTFNIGASTVTATSGQQPTANGVTVMFTDVGGSLPTGLSIGTIYYVVNLSGLTFQVSATSGGAPISLSGSATGSPVATQVGGNGVRVTQTGAGTTWREEGVLIEGWRYISNGPYGVQINNSLTTHIVGSIIDQWTQNGVFIGGGAADAGVFDSYVGTINTNTDSTASIFLDGTAGAGTKILGNTFYNVYYGINASSDSGTSGAPDVNFSNNTAAFVKVSMALFDSVANVKAEGNIDETTGGGLNTGGSIATYSAFQHGTYTLANNFFQSGVSNPPSNIDTGATYNTSGNTGMFTATQPETIPFVIGTTGNAPTNSATTYLWNTTGAFVNYVQGVATKNGHFQNLRMASNVAIAAGTWAFQTYLNGSATGPTCSMTSSATSCSDTSNTGNITAGQTYAIRVTPTSTPTSAVFTGGIEFVVSGYNGYN